MCMSYHVVSNLGCVRYTCNVMSTLHPTSLVMRLCFVCSYQLALRAAEAAEAALECDSAGELAPTWELCI